jgi:tetratricopeptide (TPR) repeat protein
MRRALLVFFCLPWFLSPCFAHHIKQASAKTLEVTTSSVKARDLYERAMTDYESYYLERANVGWRAAITADPDLAMAHAWLSYNSQNPEESSAARAKAKELASKVTPGERLMITWITSVEENNFIAGISAMNDLLEMYPKDKRVIYLAGNWMMGEREYERASRQFEKSLAVDKNYAPALNDLGYAYAHQHQFDKAFAVMERQIAVRPNQPNPQDSYAEILRMSGNFEGALQHYHASLAIDPQFSFSLLGIADTYALMGDETRARVEYDKAIAGAKNDGERMEFTLQKAQSWVREGNFAEADKAYGAAAERAHGLGMDLMEAQAHRMMAMYQSDDAASLKHLESAEDALSHRAQIAETEKEEERAKILRYRVGFAAHSGNQELAQKTLNQLEAMANGGHSSNIQAEYHGAQGTLLMSKEKYADAIPQLEEDRNNPYSMELLAKACAEAGSADEMHEVDGQLRALNTPTVEQALVVPLVRGKRPEN